MVVKKKEYKYESCKQCKHGYEEKDCPCDSCIVGTDETEGKMEYHQPCNYSHYANFGCWSGTYWTAPKWGR